MTALVAGAMAAPAAAYDVGSHQELSRQAGLRSVAYTDPGLFADLALSPVAVQTFATVTGVLGSFAATLAFGARYEDEAYLIRPFNHFFDPQYADGAGRGLNRWVAGHPSPTWALEDLGEVTDLIRGAGTPQEFSYRNAQQQFYAALTGATPPARRLGFSLMAQSLGQVIHHLQDMAQPQHTRNDIHPDFLTKAAFHEHYAARHLLSQIPLLLKLNPYPVPSFPTARHFWHTPSGTGSTPGAYAGMAEYSSRNFVSSGTLFESTDSGQLLPAPDFPLPGPFNADGSAKTIVGEQRTVTLWDGDLFTGTTYFVRGLAFDGYLPALSRPNLRIASLSLLDRHRRSVGRGRRFAENSAVFTDLWAALIPRAVAFSAGLINHFFRGRLDLQRNPGGPGWTVTNRSGTWVGSTFVGQALEGTVSFFYDDVSDRRFPVAGATFPLNLAAGQSRQFTFPEPPLGTQRMVAAFRGRIGQEGDPSGQSGYESGYESSYYTTAGRVVRYSAPPVACPGATAVEGSSAGLTRTMELGTTKGNVQLEFESYQIPDQLELRADNAEGSNPGTKLAATNGWVSGFRNWSFSFDPAALGTSKARLKITGNKDPATLWTSTLGCPGQALNNSHRRYPRVPVTLRWGSVLKGAMGGCFADLYLDSTWITTLSVTATGGGSARTVTLSKGPGHGYEYRNHSCQSGTRNILLGGTYADSTGVYPLEAMGKPGIHHFDVR